MFKQTVCNVNRSALPTGPAKPKLVGLLATQGLTRHGRVVHREVGGEKNGCSAYNTSVFILFNHFFFLDRCLGAGEGAGD